ncbi:MAG: elongation factor P [Alphaproteobacteria bacterium]|nr:elongation factor P [Alphaproteobacteria bacterium]
MKINANELRQGNVLEFRGKLWAVVKAQHITPGKGGAFVQVELRDLAVGTKLNERFRSGETVERVRIDEEDFQYLFGDDENLTFMNQETFEQIQVPRDLVGESAGFLQDGMKVSMSLHEGNPISVTLPQTVVLEIVEADPVVKGQTASSSYKTGRLSNGMRVQIPPHIESGTKIVVNTADCTYSERFKG